MSKLIRISKLIIINSIVILTLLFVIEGFSSYVLIGRKIHSSVPVAEREHTEYDPELGWINLPNAFIKDMYGPGVYLQTNAQRFRNSESISKEIPDGMYRVICSGDSFTLGYGVDNDHTWCQQLANMNERLESVNLGQGGYGVDQAYLWYKRNETEFEQNFQIFAFITDGFRRMQSETFVGYGRPFLEIQDNTLVQRNYPVPKRSYFMPRLTDAIRRLDSLGTVRLVGFLSRKISAMGRGSIVDAEKHAADVVALMFADLFQSNRKKQSELVLVYLPELGDYMGDDPDTAHWRRYVQEQARENGYHFVDGVDELRSLPPEEVKKLFDDHYSVHGNKYIANILYKKVNEISSPAHSKL